MKLLVFEKIIIWIQVMVFCLMSNYKLIYILCKVWDSSSIFECEYLCSKLFDRRFYANELLKSGLKGTLEEEMD